jgi:hypothetical protein
MLATIYGLHHPTTGELRYIGKTTESLERRMSAHRRDAKSLRRRHVYNWWRSLEGEPVLRVLAQCQASAAGSMERTLIAAFRAKGARLTNLTDGGEGVPGRVCSPETRAKMSASNVGKKRTAETRARISAAQKGRVHSAERRAKNSAANKGKKLTEEHKARISAAQKGKRHSAETRAKIGAARRATAARKREAK